MKHTTSTLLAGLLALAIVAAACGSDGATNAATTGSTAAEATTVATTADADAAAGAIEMSTVLEVSGEALEPYDAEVEDPSVGTAAPSFRTVDPTGRDVEVGPGEPTILAFLVHWCPHCQAELPVLGQSITDGKTQGVNIVAVSTAFNESRGNWPPSAWFEAESWPSSIAVDSSDAQIATAFGMTSFPFLVAIDDQGTVVGRRIGGGEAQVAELIALATGA